MALTVQDRVVDWPDSVGGREDRTAVAEVERVVGLAGFELFDGRVAGAVQDDVPAFGGVAQELPFRRVEPVVDGVVRAAVQGLVQQSVEGCHRRPVRSRLRPP
jgi:hypothetical protein